MFRRLLIPLDGSALAERAIPCARAIAASTGAQLVLLHVSQQPARTRSAAASSGHLDRIAALAAELRTAGLDVQVTSRSQYTEEVGAVIAATAAELGVDLIVLSTHGRGGLNRLVYGSVADQVMRRAPGLVLVIPASSQADCAAGGPGEILVPLDGSELAESALEPASELARALGSGLYLLRVVEFPVMVYAEGLAYTTYQPDVELDEARTYLEQVAARLADQGLRVNWGAEEGYPVTVIANRARERDVSLIAMATHGRGGLVRVVLGSVATGTLQRAGVPLLLARPAAAAGAASAEEPLAATQATPGEPGVVLELSSEERILLRHALGELLYSPQQDWRLAPAARQLLERLREPVEPPSTPPPGTPPRNVVVL